MKTGNLLFSAVQFVFAVLVIFLGGLFVGMEHSPLLRFSVAKFVTESSASLATIGYAAILTGIALMAGFYFMHRGTYYKVGMGGAEVDPAVIQSYAQDYFKRILPEQEVAVQVSFRKDQKLEMFVELPSLVDEKEFFENAEKELSRILSQQLGYRKEFLLSVLIK